ncbi:sugar transferase [Pseudonocardia humida]|uniref:Sugar transferase n=1 Tax=Pseudonocardia humida TaxID=2800819 RepID=A0ABT1A5R0_9PSEU|nr:sugar transferase [Pseudonocardia humida]MCO1658084.1 sugar transferase [Pseudonocardia humida]
MVAITAPAARPLRFAPTGGRPPARVAGAAVKQLLDVVGALTILLLTLPILIAVALAVRADGGPAFFTQTRIGRDGRTFRMVKFRSMVVDAEARKAALMAANEGAGPLFKMKNDPRVTRIGAVIRKYSIDELPQLFNVLTGSMSLIGPRPCLPTEATRYTAEMRRRHQVKPGLTGLWQVSGRSNLSWDESVALDLRYVDDWSLLMDIRIAAKTFGAVMASRGAY